MKNVLLILAVVVQAFAVLAETWEIGATGAAITAMLADGRLTLSGNGKTVDFESVASTPWSGQTITDVVFNGDITPGKNLLAGLDDCVTINGSMPIRTLRDLSDAFLAGEVAPVEAGGLSLGEGKMVMSVDVDRRDSEKGETWSKATVESVETNAEGEVILTIPVGIPEGIYRLRTK